VALAVLGAGVVTARRGTLVEPRAVVEPVRVA
jgi:hypothetical protein